jgi:hypothetical protein
MIRIQDYNVRAVRLGTQVIKAIYIGAKLVWNTIRSCFGSGYWDNDRPWDNDDAWQN